MVDTPPWVGLSVIALYTVLQNLVNLVVRSFTVGLSPLQCGFGTFLVVQ